MNLLPFSTELGIVVTGIDLGKPIDLQTGSRLEPALAEHLVQCNLRRGIELPEFVGAAAEQQPDYPGKLLEHDLGEHESR